MSQNNLTLICFALIGVGILLILAGLVLTWRDASSRRPTQPTAHPESLDKTIDAVARLVKALKDYPPGLQLIVWGIVLVIIGAFVGGVGGLTS